MEGTGALTDYMNVAQMTLYAFWLFLAGLIVYLRMEDKREGYPLQAEANENCNRTPEKKLGFPAPPSPKVFKLADGRSIQVPRAEKTDYELNTQLRAEPTAPWDGAPLEPTGNPMVDGLGPAAWAKREDEPEVTHGGKQKICPLRVATEFEVGMSRDVARFWPAIDPDPRGYQVLGCDGKVAGKIVDIWVDRGELRPMYLEMDLSGVGSSGDRVLLPINFARVGYDSKVRVNAITGQQFTDVPRLREADRISPQEEDFITGYFGGGVLYAVPGRTEPFL
ncbi:photosynthetic reaction center subunit H [Halorhodospira halophila]|uniref:photosynthetic reaction center subunit H n=1 Tax=Halorhodospira halophila TaxID=1053 RepID=UPI001913071B|nr:photosynthetic reaction center subunit H [Halorhodospira halophila]MBK5943943.1 photosynthetic reaction center subunit H [Halorhodospira halophila]